jgi:hypothetical protein
MSVMEGGADGDHSGPLFAKRSLFGLNHYDRFFLGMGIIMAIWGTGAAFWAAGSS